MKVNLQMSVSQISTAAMQRAIRILIVDDHAVVRAGLRMLVEHDHSMTVVGMAGNRSEALSLAASEQPDIIVLDILLGDDDGLSFLPELCEASPKARVLVLTGVRSSDFHRRAIRQGAMGVVLKEHAADMLLKAINKVHRGEVWIDRTMMGSVLQEITKPAAEPEKVKIDTLTNREREVITLVGEGLRNKQIAERLFITETTVTHHLTSVFSKLEVSDRLELIIYAFRQGLAQIPR
ncbi:response regulator transcription factor [soil metagenome]